MSNSAKPPSIPKFRSIKTVAERLDVSPRSVQRLIETGELPAYKFGGALRVSDDDLQQLVDRCRHRKGQED